MSQDLQQTIHAQLAELLERRDPDRLIGLSRVLQLTGFGRNTILTLVDEGRFPRPAVRYTGFRAKRKTDSPRATKLWRESEVRAWVDRLIAAGEGGKRQIRLSDLPAWDAQRPMDRFSTGAA